MKEQIEKFQAEIEAIEKRRKALQNAIDALRNVCDHKFEPAGHTHKAIEKCSECGMEISF